VFDYVPFNHQDGESAGKDLKLLAYSTCAFCKRAMRFLEQHGIAYDYVLVDKLDSEKKDRVKRDFQEKFGKKLTYPNLVIDGEEILTGFVRPAWKETLGIHEE
jgi:glutaredoxin